MANEITQTASLSAFKPTSMGSAIGRSISNVQITMNGNVYVQDSILVQTSATLIPLGQVVNCGAAWFANLDNVNFITIRNGIASLDLLQIPPLWAFPCYLLAGAIPYAVANTAACQMEYLILSA